MNLKRGIRQSMLASVAVLGLFTQTHAQDWTLTPTSLISFDIKSVGLSVVKGTFHQQQSSMHFDLQSPQNASIELTLMTNSLSFSKPVLKNMILGEDFFKAAQYKTVMFKSTDFQPLGNNRYRVNGYLTLRGITKLVILDTVLIPNASHSKLLDVQSSTVINRRDFGMKKAFGGVGEKVNIYLTGQWKVK